MWLRLARRRITLPVPVSRNRFLAPLWVFIFGMVAVVSVSQSLAAAFTAVGHGTQQSPFPALALSAGPPGISPAGVLLPARPDPVPWRPRRRVRSPQVRAPLPRGRPERLAPPDAGWARTCCATARRVPWPRSSSYADRSP